MNSVRVRKTIVSLLVCVTLLGATGLVIYGMSSRSVGENDIPPYFAVVARDQTGHFVPLVLYEWSSYVQGAYPPALYPKMKTSGEFCPYWAGMRIVSRAEHHLYDFQAVLTSVEQAMDDLNSLPSQFQSTARYRVEVPDPSSREVTLFRSTNSTDTFRYRVDESQVVPLTVAGTARARGLVAILFFMGQVAIVGAVLAYLALRVVARSR